jgi:hypothetical protein
MNPDEVVFLLDVDNTLPDNTRVQPISRHRPPQSWTDLQEIIIHPREHMWGS